MKLYHSINPFRKKTLTRNILRIFLLCFAWMYSQPNSILPNRDHFLFTIAEDDSMIIELKEIFTDSTQFFISDSAKWGVTTLTDTTLTYVSFLNYTGDDRFIFRSEIDSLDSVTFHIQVTPVNDPPRFILDRFHLKFDEDDTLVFQYDEWRGQIFDPDSLDDLNFSIESTENITLKLFGNSLEAYSPKDWNGNDTLAIIITDGMELDTAALYVEVMPVNDPPVFENENLFLQVTEDEEWNADISRWFDEIKDIDNPISDLSWSVVSGHSINAVLEDTVIRFTAEDHWFGIDSIQIFVSDGDLFAAVTLAMIVNPVNDPPKFIDKLPAVTWAEDDTLKRPYSAFYESVEDVDNIPQELSWTFLHGDHIQIISETDSILYSNDENWNGSDTVVVIVSDGILADTTSTIVTVYPVNDPPVITGYFDLIQFDEDMMFDVDLLDWLEKVDDPDTERSNLQIQVTAGKNLIAEKRVDGFTISSLKNWYGNDSLIVHVSDGMLSDTAVLKVKVRPINDPPVLSLLDDITFFEDDSLTIFLSDLHLNIKDPDNQLSDMTWAFRGEDSVIIKANDTSAVFSAPKDWFGTEIAAIILSDGALTDTAYVTLSVLPVNDPPIFTNALPEYSGNEDEAIPVYIQDWYEWIQDIDNTSEEMIFTVMDGQATKAEKNPNGFVLIPQSNWYGNDTLTVTVFDGEYFDENEIIVWVEPVNDPPILINNFTELRYLEDQEELIRFSDWNNRVVDIDDSVDSLSWEVKSGRNIEVVQNREMGILVSPQNWFGHDTLLVIVSDGEFKDFTLLPIEIISVNDPPRLSKILPDTAFYEDGFLRISDLRWKDFVVDPDDLFKDMKIRVTGMQHLSASGSENTMDFYAPNNWFGMDKATLLISDGEYTDSSTFRIHVFPVNDSPSLSPISDIVMDEDTEFALNLSLYVEDVDNDKTTLTWSAYLNEPSLKTKIVSDKWFYSPSTPQNPQELLEQYQEHIQIEIDPETHNARFIPNPNFFGESNQYILKVQDDNHASDIQIVNITVLPVNDPPVLDTIPEIVFHEDELFTNSYESLFPFVTDIDDHDSTLTWEIRSGENIMFESKVNSFELKGDKHWFGIDTLDVFVQDKFTQDTSQVIVSILPVNDPPSSFELINHIIGDSATIDFQWYPSTDIDNDTLMYNFYLRGDQLDTSIVNIQDYHVIFNGKDILHTGIPYEWYVEVYDGNNTTRCTNPKKFYLQHIPGDFSLSQNFPNPFNKETTIPFDVAKYSRVKLMIYDMHGKEVVRLLEEYMSPGHYEVKWDGKDKTYREVASGVYLITMMADKFSQVRKIMLIK